MEFLYLLYVFNLFWGTIISTRENLTIRTGFSDLTSIANGMYRNYSFPQTKEKSRPKTPTSSRIIGGSVADIKKFPSVACIIVKYMEVDDFRGGATIIRENWAITAAHCMTFISNEMIRFKQTFVRSNSAMWKNHYIDHLVVKSYVHENYDEELIDYDIALLKVFEPFVGGYEKPVKFAARNYHYKDHSTATILGWGTTDVSPSEPYAVETLRYVDIQLMNFETCKKTYKELNETVTEHMICAAEPGKDACFYDSGGPLFQNNILIGIVSWGGTSCADIKMPGVYTKLSKFYEWINKKLTPWK